MPRCTWHGGVTRVATKGPYSLTVWFRRTLRLLEPGFPRPSISSTAFWGKSPARPSWSFGALAPLTPEHDTRANVILSSTMAFFHPHRLASSGFASALKAGGFPCCEFVCRKGVFSPWTKPGWRVCPWRQVCVVRSSRTGSSGSRLASRAEMRGTPSQRKQTSPIPAGASGLRGFRMIPGGGVLFLLYFSAAR